MKYADAGMDMKKLGLCLLRKCWLVLAAGVIGALLGGALYTLVTMTSERTYKAVSKVYLDFAADETGEVYQHYNGYTWNDLMATDPILDVTMRQLPQDYERAEVMAATQAEILSDVRLLTITITAHDSDRCNAILHATGQSLTALGDTAKEFQQIRVIQTTEAALVVADDRTKQAVLAGAVLAVAATLLAMLLYYVLDDRIMVANDLKPVTEAPFLGYAGAGGRLQEDYEDSLAYLRGKRGQLAFLTQGQTGAAGTGAAQGQEVSAAWETGLDAQTWERLRAADGVVLLAAYGKAHATALAYVIEQLRLRGCDLMGVAICGADGKFLRRYYGRAFGRDTGAETEQA